MKTLNLNAREGDVDDSFFLDLEADLGTNWNGLIECQLDREGDSGISGNHDGERFDSGDINGGWFRGSS